MNFEQFFDTVISMTDEYAYQLSRLGVQDQTFSYVLGEWTAWEEIADYMREHWGTIGAHFIRGRVHTMLKTRDSDHTYFRYKAFEKGYKDSCKEMAKILEKADSFE